MVADAQIYIDRYKDNYELWMNEIMGATITPDQKKCADVLINQHFLSAKSGTTTGKTAFAATTCLWFLTTHPESKIPCTAPTGHQLEDLLFAEIQSWKRRIKYDRIRNSIRIIKDKVFIEGYREWYIVARTIPKDSKDKLGDVLAGFHAPYLMFVVDEASGVPDPVFKGIEGSMIQKNVWCALVGNPTRDSGYFFDTHTSNKASWGCVTLSSLRSPFVQQAWVERMRNLHGEDSDFFRTKVLGEFPRSGSSAIVSSEELHGAFARWHERQNMEHDGMLVAGLDPAAGKRDNSILTFRRGSYIFEPIRIKHNNTEDLSEKAVNICKDRGARELYIEYNGLGVGVFDQCKGFQKKGSGVKSYKVVTNERANDPQGYRNLRAELFCQIRNHIDELAIPPHDRYIKEASEIILLPDKDRIQIEEKVKIRSRLGFSPDYFDSLMISTFRQFNLNSVGSGFDENQLSSFATMNKNLAMESSFEKI